MNPRRKARHATCVVATLCLVGPVAACGTREPPPDLDAPATLRESMILGVDATDPYFLTRFRKCVQWKSQQICKREPYGEDNGGYE